MKKSILIILFAIACLSTAKGISTKTFVDIYNNTSRHEVLDLTLREVDSFKEEVFYYEFVDNQLHLYGNIKTGLADGITLQCTISADSVNIVPLETPDMIVTSPSMYKADAWFKAVESYVRVVTYKGEQIEKRTYQEAPCMEATSAEGATMKFCVLNEMDKTCMVGTGDYDTPAVAPGLRGVVTIPSVVDGYAVTKICAKAFAACAIDSLIIPEGVKVIGAEMVDGCANLKHISIPSSAEWIGPQAFRTGYDWVSVVTCINNLSVLWPAKPVFTTWKDNDLGINPCANATLYVPSGMKEEYLQCRDWKLFANIVEGVATQAESTSFVQEGKQWKTKYHNGYLNDQLGVKHLYHYDFVIDGDTIIHSKTCKKMYVDSSLGGSRKEYLLAMYEEGKKVYVIPKESTEGLLLYDFGAETGDKIEVYTSPNITPFLITYQPRPETMHVLDVVTRVYHGVERRCLYVIAESDYQTFAEDDQPFTLEDLEPYCGWWIEGIGTEGYPFNNTMVGILGNGGNSTWLCMTDTDTLYTNGTFDPTANKCLVDGGMSWIQRYANDKCSPEYRYTEKRHFYFKEDEGMTIIGGHPCRMLYASVLDEEQNEHIVAALYEEDGRVYCYPWRGAEEAHLLYDFRANMGDELTVGVLNFDNDFEKEHEIELSPCQVVRVTEEDFFGIKRRCLYLKEPVYTSNGYVYFDHTEEDGCWIEGIGSTAGIANSLGLVQKAGSPFKKLLECAWMGDIYYHAEDDNLPDDIRDIRIDRNAQSSKDVFYDLTGRPVSAPSKGIYIQNGKKVLVK